VAVGRSALVVGSRVRRRTKTLISSSTITRLDASPMQIHHCSKVSDVVENTRWRNPIAVMLTIASSEMP
jgi:hypothetical protein